MTNHQNFVNWLEGYLDACKNKLSAPQIKEIRKKMSEIKEDSLSEMYTSLWNSEMPPAQIKDFPTVTLVTPKKDEPCEEYLEAIEKNKNASTMEDLEN
jgi:hypothetical protein